MNNAVKDYPKISSPFVRKEINGKYLATPEIQKGYDWVFSDEGVHAVDKLHGCLHYHTKILTDQGLLLVG